MTSTSGDADEPLESSYTDMQIHDEELPEDLRPENDLDPGSTPGPNPGPDGPGDEEQLGQVPEGTQTGSEGDAAASDAPASAT
jgi:hypothetical protein